MSSTWSSTSCRRTEGETYPWAGYSVYFEMRRGGKPINPMTWIDGTGLKPAAQG